ncbi:MAG: phage integrase family protein [Oligoflexia bacterium]|nr:phage integrase family protein [Oligoflexia bacterium]
MTKVFNSLKNHKGIRKDNRIGKYQARKYINKKEYSDVFDKIKDAIRWRNEFHPDLEPKILKNKSTVKLNGVEEHFSFREIWENYQKLYLPSLTIQSQFAIKKRLGKSISYFKNYLMVEINANVIDQYVENLVKEAKRVKNQKRYSFDKEISALRALLNWYRENYDAMFVVPILKRHFILGKIREKVKKKEKMTAEHVQLFFEAIESQFWKDFAEIHFYMAGRVQEPSGLQVENVDLKNRVLKVSDVTVWGNDKQFLYLKEIPKNGEERLVHINDRMYEILKRRINDRPDNLCPFKRESNSKALNFVFHDKGMPLKYRQIQHHYNRALKKAGLYPRFSATHILRKAMANLVRQNLGIDAAQAVGGWKSRDVVEKVYTDLNPNSLNKEAVNLIGELLTGTNRYKSKK